MLSMCRQENRKCSRHCKCSKKKSFKPNSRLVDNSAKYAKFHIVQFDSVTKEATLTYDQLVCSDVSVGCNGGGANKDVLITYKLFLPDLGVPASRFVRQYFQMQQIPINFIVSRLSYQLVGNAVLEIYFDNVLASTIKNPFYQITPPLVTSEPFRILRIARLYYAKEDDELFKLSPYYCEPLVPQPITNGCIGC